VDWSCCFVDFVECLRKCPFWHAFASFFFS
jgi:hypothetical protein